MGRDVGNEAISTQPPWRERSLFAEQGGKVVERSYWENTLGRRIVSRRKAMALAGGTATAAAILAACGGSSSSNNNSKASNSASSSGGGAGNGLPANAKEATYSPSKGTFTPGGTFRQAFNSAGENFNPVTQWTDGTSLGGILVYDRPLTSREDSRRYVLEAMASIETPDPLTVVMKLRPGLLFQNVAPVNGRSVK